MILVIDLENLPTHMSVAGFFYQHLRITSFFTEPYSLLIGFGAMTNLFIIMIRNEFICGADVLATKLRITHFYGFIQRKGQ